MTHHSSVRYGGYVLADNGSCAKSGPVRARYVNPESASIKPAKKLRTDRSRSSDFRQGFVPSLATPVTFGGVAYQSMREAAKQNGLHHLRFVRAKQNGLTELDGKTISFG